MACLDAFTRSFAQFLDISGNDVVDLSDFHNEDHDARYDEGPLFLIMKTFQSLLILNALQARIWNL